MFELKSTTLFIASMIIAALIASVVLVAGELLALTGFIKFLFSVVTVLVASAMPITVRATQF